MHDKLGNSVVSDRIQASSIPEGKIFIFKTKNYVFRDDRCREVKAIFPQRSPLV
ncbi:hypothetical protein [Nostoc sp.]|uniref:hypothetical protein n=1 Tax=Nostoc sp. TaxID=1180 RepID=UPI002FF9D1AB